SGALSLEVFREGRHYQSLTMLLNRCTLLGKVEFCNRANNQATVPKVVLERILCIRRKLRKSHRYLDWFVRVLAMEVLFMEQLQSRCDATSLAEEHVQREKHGRFARAIGSD